MIEEKYIDSDGQVLKVEIHLDGTKIYYNSNNQSNRLDGPAIEYVDGSYDWYKEGSPHRIGGPSFFDTYDNYCEWDVNGKFINVYYICG